MEFLPRRNAMIGYLSGLAAIIGLMLMIFSGVTAVQPKPAGSAKISMFDRY